MTLYTEYQPSAAPVWLQRPNGRAWNEAHGLVKDVFVDACRVATKAGWPLATPADGLPFVGQERSLPRVPSDTDETYRSTLVSAWDLWDFGGTEQGVLAAVGRRFPASSPSILTYWDNPSFFGVDDARWARFALFLTINTWSAAQVWGGGITWGAPSLTWGISAPQGEVAELLDIVSTWQDAAAVCTKIVVTTPSGDITIL